MTDLRWLPVTAFLLAALPAAAEENRVSFPDISTMEHFTTVRRGAVTEHMLTPRAAIDAHKAGDPMPYGTQVVLADYRDGALYRLFVMERGEGWGAEYDEATRTGDWQFQWYWPDGSVNMAENTARCRSCHQSRENAGYMFTAGTIHDFD